MEICWALIFLSLHCLEAQSGPAVLGINNDKTPQEWGTLTLGEKIEKILAIKGHPRVEKVKEDMKTQIEYNFIKKLAANVLLSNGIKGQEVQENILQLMRRTLNGELDFMPVVAKIPILLGQTDEEKRFKLILNAIQEKQVTENNETILQELRQQQSGGGGNNGTQTTKSPSQFEQIIDAASKINIKDLSMFLKEIPEIFEGIQTIVDSVNDIFGE